MFSRSAIAGRLIRPATRRAGRFAALRALARDRQARVRVLAVFLLTRLVLYVTGALAIRMLPPDSPLRPMGLLGQNLSLVGRVRWDAGCYLASVGPGYSIGPDGASNVAWLPPRPVLIKRVAISTAHVVAAGLLVANLAAIGATLALWRWVRAEAGPAAADRSVLWLLV